MGQVDPVALRRRRPAPRRRPAREAPAPSSGCGGSGSRCPPTASTYARVAVAMPQARCSRLSIGRSARRMRPRAPVDDARDRRPPRTVRPSGARHSMRQLAGPGHRVRVCGAGEHAAAPKLDDAPRRRRRRATVTAVVTSRRAVLGERQAAAMRSASGVTVAERDHAVDRAAGARRDVGRDGDVIAVEQRASRAPGEGDRLHEGAHRLGVGRDELLCRAPSAACGA